MAQISQANCIPSSDDFRGDIMAAAGHAASNTFYGDFHTR